MAGVFLKGKQPTFDKIVEGIDACLAAEININLRMVIDKENIENLAGLSRFAIDKGWTASPFSKHKSDETTNCIFAIVHLRNYSIVLPCINTCMNY